MRAIPSDAYIIADAYNEGDVFEELEVEPENITNNADVDITAGEDVKVMAFDGGDASIAAYANTGTDNTSNVTITTVGGDVLVHSIDGKDSRWSGFTPSSASIEAIAEDAGNKNTANIQISATATTTEYEEDVEGETLTFVEVYGGDVKVIGVEGGEAEITAIAKDAEGFVEKDDDGLPVNGPSNTANVTIRTTAVELVGVEQVDKDEFVYVEDGDSFIVGGDVVVKAKKFGSGPPSKASIEAVTLEGFSNTSGVLICAEGEVVVEGVKKGEALIKAIAHFGHLNDAYVGIKADVGVKVLASHGGEASILSRALFGYDNDAFTQICTDGGILVIGEMGGDAEILAEAKEGVENDAYVAVCAVDDIIVAAGFNPKNILEGEDIGKIGSGGSATIKAEAAQYLANGVRLAVNGNGNGNYEPTSANATTTVISHEGGVAVIDIADGGRPQTAKIEAEAHNAWYNTADVGVSAGGDLLNAEHPLYEGIEGLGVLVASLGEGSVAYIKAFALDGIENTADVVICTPGLLEVWSEGGWAAIGPWALGGELNLATAQVYAGDVFVSEDAYIGAVVPGDWKYVTDWSLGNKLPEGEEGDGATLIIDTYENAQDCPTCPPCPICDEIEALLAPLAPVAPLYQVQIVPRIEGCPVEMAAAASELGITAETIQVGIGNALALNPSIQPCQACATLVNAANILRDEDGSRMAAMVQTFNALAPAGAPFTPEMATSIAMAFEGAAEGTQYASAMEYIDAFVQYVVVLDIDLGSPVGDGDSVAFVMEKYGAGITGSDNANMAAFVATRLEAIGG